MIYGWRMRRYLAGINTSWVHFNYIGLDGLVRKKQGVKYTAISHGIGWDFPTNGLPEKYIKNTPLIALGSRYQKLKMILAQNSSLIRMDKILSVDTNILRYAQFFFTNKREKIEVIYNFVDTAAFKPGPKHANKIIKILYPRNISLARGVHLLVPIAKELKNARIAFNIQIVGAAIKQLGANKYETTLREEIQKNELQDNFEFLGRVKHEEMPDLFQKSDIVIIPTYFSEGTSLSCLEAMACQKPVVATNIGGLNDLIISGYNGLLSNPNPRDFSANLISLAQDPLRASSYADRAYEIALINNTHAAWVRKVRGFFE